MKALSEEYNVFVTPGWPLLSMQTGQMAGESMFQSPAMVFTCNHLTEEWRGRGPWSVGKHAHRLTRMEILFLVCLKSTAPQLPLPHSHTNMRVSGKYRKSDMREIIAGKKRNRKNLQERRAEQPTANQFQLSIKASVLIYLLSANWDVCDPLWHWMTAHINRCPLMEVSVHACLVFGFGKIQGGESG